VALTRLGSISLGTFRDIAPAPFRDIPVATHADASCAPLARHGHGGALGRSLVPGNGEELSPHHGLEGSLATGSDLRQRLVGGGRGAPIFTAAEFDDSCPGLLSKFPVALTDFCEDIAPNRHIGMSVTKPVNKRIRIGSPTRARSILRKLNLMARVSFKSVSPRGFTSRVGIEGLRHKPRHKK